jgi:hypothetical protein
MDEESLLLSSSAISEDFSRYDARAMSRTTSYLSNLLGWEDEEERSMNFESEVICNHFPCNIIVGVPIGL